MAIDSIPGRLLRNGETLSDKAAYAVKSNNAWVTTDYGTYARQVRQAARALIALGMPARGSVCILGFNRPEWAIMDVACMMAGGAPAGIYTTNSPVEVQYIVDHSEATVVLVENQDQWAKVQSQLPNLPKLKWVVLMEGAEAVSHDMVLTWSEFLAKGDDTEDSAVDARLEGLEEDQVATYIYTSGTTGPPKAVMLSHKNLTWTADIAGQMVDLKVGDRSVSYLPLSHIAEQMFTLHGPISQGSVVYFAESMEPAILLQNFQEVKPTILFGVPRIWEKFHARLSGALKDASGLKALIVRWARGVGAEMTRVRNAGETPGGWLLWKYGKANKLFFSKLKPRLGLGEARICVSGAAPIAAEVLEFFGTLDITIHEVYGQSEDTGPTSFNLPGRTKFGTVGPAVPGVEVRIADDGEIQVRGPNVFLGYYKEPEATAETLVDGWLCSGDLGSLDSEGFLTITGRKKEIIITAGGKNIAPKNLEAALKESELVSQAVVIGDRRKFLSALLTLEPTAVEAFASEHGIEVDGIATNPTLLQAIQAHVDTANEKFARVEHTRKFTVLPRDFTIEDGELTPTLKIKRKVIYEHFADEIEAMYADA